MEMEEARSASASGAEGLGIQAEVDSAVPLRIPPVPPPKDDNTPQAPSISRYRTLRGKSVSSPRRNRNKPGAFDIYRDQQDTQSDNENNKDGSNASPTRNRSLSAAAAAASTRSGNNAAKRRAEKIQQQQQQQQHQHQQQTASPTPPLPTIKSPLNPKPINLSSPNPSNRLINLPASKSGNLVRPATPEPRAPQNESQSQSLGVGAETEEQAQRRRDREEAARWASEVARLEAETDRILAEQKKRDLARLQAQLATVPSPKPKSKRPILDKLTFLRSPRPIAPNQPSTPKSAPAKILGFTWSPATPTANRALSPESMSLNLIEPGGKGIVPQTDAPASASNGGERRVTVRCLSSTINLPVTNNTNPVDIVYSTANLVAHKIVPADCIILECYEVLGLERRLRNYERIRDVMNSWDRDQQNTLLVSAIDTNNQDLELASVPRTDEAPTGFTFQLYHSSRPGKWNKRYVTLMDTGQMFAAKRPDSKFTDKDTIALCHLSDFDIYTPGETQLRRHLKPPKKYCYAIKSQQKTNLFPNGENFVHFFSAEDDQLAHRFYELIHGWRSWYLANKKVDILPKEEQSPSVRRTGTRSRRSTSVSKQSARHQSPQVEKVPYTIGELQPLIDMKQFDKPLEEFGKNLPTKKGQESTPAPEETKPKVLSKVRPPPPKIPSTSQGESDFLAGGLLGAAYDKRKAADPMTEVKKVEGPFVEGSLLNRLPTSPTSPVERPEPQSWFPSAAEHSMRSRSQSRPTLSRPKTAETSRTKPHPSGHGHPEMPRRAPSQRQGIGRGVKPPAGGPLVDFATGGVSQNQQKIALSRSSSKASSASGAPHSGRPRSRSRATSRSGGQRHIPADQPPVPPLPFRSARRPERVQTDPMRGREKRPQEPLINQVK